MSLAKPEAPVRTCLHCNAQIKDTAKFCSKCGAPQPEHIHLKKCRECGHPVARSAHSCPNCGAKNPAVGKALYSIAVLVSAILAIAVAVWVWNGPAPVNTRVTPPEGTEIPPATGSTGSGEVPTDMERALPKYPGLSNIDSYRLTADYDSNEVAADEKYKGQVVEVNGQVGLVGRDEQQRLYVKTWAPDPDEAPEAPQNIPVYFFFPDQQQAALAQLAKFQTFHARCICEGKSSSGNVVLDNCIIIDQPTDWRGKCDADGNCYGR